MWAPMPGAGGCFYLPLLLNQLHCLGDYLLSWYLHNARDCSSALLEEAADACRFLPSISITLDDKNDGLKLKAGARDPNYLSHIFFSFLSPLSILFFMLKCKRLDRVMNHRSYHRSERICHRTFGCFLSPYSLVAFCKYFQVFGKITLRLEGGKR